MAPEYLPEEILLAIFWAVTQDGRRRTNYRTLTNCMLANKTFCRIAREPLHGYESLSNQPLRLMHALETGNLETTKDVFSGKWKRPVKSLVAIRLPYERQPKVFDVLTIAAAFGNLSILEYLLSIGASTWPRHIRLETQYMLAGFTLGNSDGIPADALPLEYNAPYRPSWVELKIGRFYEEPPDLSAAIGEGHEDAALLLLKKRGISESSDDDGKYQLFEVMKIALHLCSVKVIKYMVQIRDQFGIDFTDCLQKVSWSAATRELVECLVAQGSDPKGRIQPGDPDWTVFNVTTIFGAACHNNNFECANALLDAGACTTEPVETLYENANFLATMTHDIDEAAWLMQRIISQSEFNINWRGANKWERTILYNHCFGRNDWPCSSHSWSRDFSLVRVLLKHGAELSVPDEVANEDDDDDEGDSDKPQTAVCCPFWFEALARGMSELCSLLQKSAGVRVPQTDDELSQVLLMALTNRDRSFAVEFGTIGPHEAMVLQHCRVEDTKILAHLIQISPKTSFFRQPEKMIPWLASHELTQLAQWYKNNY